MKCARSGLMVGLIVVCVLGVSGVGRAGTLALSPQKIPAEPGKWTLLPPESARVDGDAVPLYEKAIQALPDEAGDAQIQAWLKTSIDQLPVEQAERALDSYLESLKSVAQAVRQRQCGWPEWKPGAQVANIDEYRRLCFAVRLWARLEIARDGYEGAILALRTGFGMANQHGRAPTLIQSQIAIAMASMMCKEVEEFVQRPNAPNLYPALAELPKPLVEIEKAIDYEKKAAASTVRGKLFKGQYESVLRPAHDRSRLLVKRLDSNLAALQCVEAIRAYMASHDGQVPAALADITELSVPKDPMVDGPFQYTQAASGAVLESSLPPGATERDKIHFEIFIRR